MSHGVIFVVTSNTHPDNLYTHGIQRESFIPCIELLKAALKVIKLDSSIDYRQDICSQSDAYHYPLGIEAEQHVRKWFSYLGDKDDPPHHSTKKLWGRKFEVPLASGENAQLSYNYLVKGAFGAADFLELTKDYKSFIVTDVPQIDLSGLDEARRFITFVDAVYEARVSSLGSSHSSVELTPRPLI